MPVIRGTSRPERSRPSGTLYAQYGNMIDAGDFGGAISDAVYQATLLFRKEFMRSPDFERVTAEVRFVGDVVTVTLFEYPEGHE